MIAKCYYFAIRRICYETSNNTCRRKRIRTISKTAANIGTTASDALRMFIYAFNDHHGFPFPVQSKRMEVEPFDSEEEATDFATNMAKEIIK